MPERIAETAEPDFLECDVTSAEYGALVQLRFNALRAPLGLQWMVDELHPDRGDRHFGIFRGAHPLAVTVVRKLSNDSVKLRQIAVLRTMRGQGLGRRVVEAVENVLRREGVRRAELNSRQNVTGFYEALGYSREGDVFHEISIPHVKMKKTL